MDYGKDAQHKEGSHLTNNCRLMSDLKNNENGNKCYQGFQLKHFKRATGSVREQQQNICTNVKERFSDIKKSGIYENIEFILDTFT